MRKESRGRGRAVCGCMVVGVSRDDCWLSGEARGWDDHVVVHAFPHNPELQAQQQRQQAEIIRRAEQGEQTGLLGVGWGF